MAEKKESSEGRIAIFTRNFLPPTQIWILRQASGLSRYKPIFIIKNKIPNSPRSDRRIYSMQAYKAVTAFFNFCGSLFSKDSLWGSTGFLKIALWSNQVQLVHIHFLWNALWFFRICRYPKIPVVVTAHGSDVNKAFADNNYRKEIQDVFLKVDMIICVSEFIKEKLLDLGCERTKLLVNQLGIPIRNISPKKNENKEQIKLICVAGLREEKGHLYLLKAIERVKKKYGKIHLYLVGDGEKKMELVHAAQELKLEDCVEFLGWKTEDEVFELLEAADIYVQHSVRIKDNGHKKEEALSISLVEAASRGLPLVATDIGGIPEICIHGYNGLLSNEKDVQSMADNILYLIDNPETRVQFGQIGKKLVEEKFNEARLLTQLEAMYQSILRKYKESKKGGTSRQS